MTIEHLTKFRRLFDEFIKVIKEDEKYINSKSISRREKASKTLDFMLPTLRKITLHYIKRFCNERAIGGNIDNPKDGNRAFLNHIKVDIIGKVRKHVDLELPKTYAKLLKCKKK